MTPIVEGRPKSATETCLSMPGIQVDGNAWGPPVANRIYYEPIFVRTSITLDQLGIRVHAAAAGKSVRLGIYKADTGWQPTDLVIDGGAVSVATTGIKIITISQSLPTGRYLLAFSSDGTPSIDRHFGSSRYMGFAESRLVALDGFDSFVGGLWKDDGFGGYLDPGLAWDTFRIDGTRFVRHVFIRIATT